MFLSKLFRNLRAKALVALAGVTMVLGVGAAISAGVAQQENEVVETRADTQHTIYFAYDEASRDGLYVRAELNIGDNNTYWKYWMTSTNEIQGGKRVWTAQVSEKYGGVNGMKFSLWSSQAENAWVRNASVPYADGPWHTSSQWSGKLWNTSSWVTYSPDTVTKKSANTRIWVDTNGSNGGWAKDSAKLYAWVKYTTTDWAWARATWDSTAGYYFFTLTNTAAGFIFFRNNTYESWSCWNESDVSFGNSAGSVNLLDATNTDGTIPASPWSEYKVQNSGAVIHLKTGGENSGWAADSAKISAWCWKTDGAEWADATWNSSDGFYEFTLPANCSGFTLLRDSAYRTGTTWGSGDGYNHYDIHLDERKTLLDCTDVPGSLTWGYYCDIYIYYITIVDASSGDDTGDYIYSWSSDESIKYFGNWPGTQITSVDGVTTVQGDIKFNGTSAVKIYKIPLSSYADQANFKFRGGSDDYQTYNFDLVAGGAYVWTTSDPGSGVNAAMGQALEYILQIEAKRNAATHQGHEGSVCGISAGDRSTLYTAYSTGLSAAAKAYVNASYIYTYKITNSGSDYTKTDISLPKIINFFHTGKADGAAIVPGAYVKESPLTMTLWIVLGSGLAGLAAIGTAYFVSKKKKRPQA